MYEPLTDFYTEVIQSQTRRLRWSGLITDTDGGSNYYRANNIVRDSGVITRQCASSTDLTLGTVYAAEFKIGLYIGDIARVDRDKLYGGRITSNVNPLAHGVYADVPMGAFNITEATQNGDICTITAYDDMIKFDKDYLGVSGIAKPYDWAASFCSACGVTLGTTAEEFAALPNGDLDLTLVWNDDIQTYRDALSHLAAALGCVAVIDRHSALRFLPVAASSPVATVTANDRFDSDIARMTYTPRTAYLTIRETGELISREDGSGNAYLDLGTNALMQADGQVRDIIGQTVSTYSPGTMLGNIIDQASTFSTVPIEADIPCDPCLDLLDCVTLTGGQAAAGGTDVRITSLEIHIGGDTKLVSAGANIAEAKTAEQRATNGTGGEVNLLMWQATDTNNTGIDIYTTTYWGDLVGETWGEQSPEPDGTWGDYIVEDPTTTVVNTAVEPQKDWARGQLNFTVAFTLDAAMAVTYDIILNEGEETEKRWTVTEDTPAGRSIQTITTPVEFWSNVAQLQRIKVTMKGERT